jgi:putrescine transport system ATP-binding protein
VAEAPAGAAAADVARPRKAPHLRLDHVVKRYVEGGGAAVDGVSLEVKRGEFFALLGPSGCGKTTLLRLVAGFETPDRGAILIDGADMAAVPPYRRPVNMMFQSYALFPHMTVAENVGFGLKQDGRPRREVAARTAAMLDLVKLGPLADRKPAQLSGGERQRVALARALVKEPKLLLLDEPLAALDRKLREETRFELVRIQHRVGITFLMVTHDQEEAMSMASRLAVMSQGRIVQVGTPGEVYEQPQTRFVADFLGAVNLFTGRVTGAKGGLLRIDSDEAGAPLVAAHDRAIPPGTTVAVAVRPEKIALAPDAPAPIANRLAGRVRAVAYRGEASTYEVELATGKVLRVSLANTERRRIPALAEGDAASLAFSPASAVVLEG